VVESHQLHDDDRYARNTLHDPERVRPHAVEGARVEDGVLVLPLPAISWTAVRLA
jgi:alpha-N-arabinofuranosidase